MARGIPMRHNQPVQGAFVSSEAFWSLVERCALAASGFAIFGPALALQVTASSVSWIDCLALATSLVLWASAFGIRRRGIRHGFQVAGGLVLLIWPWLLPGPGAWIQPAIVGCGVMIGAVFTLRWLPALLVVLAAGILSTAISITAPPSVAFVEGSNNARLLGPLLATLVSLGFILSVASWRRLTTRIDHEEREIRVELSARIAAEELRRTQDSVARRIHETVLNSLTAISLGVPPEATDKVRQSCDEDLRAIDSGLVTVDTTEVAEIVGAAAREVSISVTLSGDLSERVDLSTEASRALRDAVVEALRNAERHAGVTEADVNVTRRADALEVAVSDQGRGITPDTPEGIGITRAIRGSIEGVGGRVNIASTPGRTRVLLSLPISQPITRMELHLRDFTESGLPGRLGLLGAAVFVALTLTPMLGNQPVPASTSVLEACFIAVSTTLAFAWTKRWRTFLSILGVALVVLTLLSLAATAHECAAVPSVSKQMLALAGAGSVIFVVAQRRALIVAAMISAIALAAIALTAQIPSACRGLPIVNLPIGIGYLIAVAVGGALANSVLERRRMNSMADWDELQRSRARAFSTDNARSMWRLVDERTKTFLADIASGSSDPGTTAAQLEASILATNVRGALTQQAQLSHPGVRLLSALVEEAAYSGARVDLEVGGTWNRDDYFPEAVVEYCHRALSNIPFTDARVSVSLDERSEFLGVLLTGREIAVGVTRSRGTFGDCEVTLDTDDLEPNVVFLAIRRPSQPLEYAL